MTVHHRYTHAIILKGFLWTSAALQQAGMQQAGVVMDSPLTASFCVLLF